MKKPIPRALIWVIPVSLGIGALLASLQPAGPSGQVEPVETLSKPASWLSGFFGASLLALIGLSAIAAAARWANGSRALAWMVALAFLLRLAVGVGTDLALPIDGYDEPDDRAGYVFSDAHRRDDQAWQLAQSERPILAAFSKAYSTDQYGGLLALSALVYRYLSPDAQRPLLLILFSALTAALGLPFLWKAALQAWGEKVALTCGWIFALYPESLLLGGAAMREPYLITFSAMALWGFVDWRDAHSRRSWLWLVLGLGGMLLVSPVAALVTLIIFGGWLWLARQGTRVSWIAVLAAVLIFLAGLLLLATALDRQGTFGGSPLGVVLNWLREAIKWDVYQLERGSGWVQKLFDEMPEWLRLPFVVGYGIFQPVLPAAFIEPTTTTWRIIGIVRAVGWYLLLPLLLFAVIAAWKTQETDRRRIWLWLTAIVWLWIILAALRGGGDQWDNPRYRLILFLWQALLAGYALVAWREQRDAWLARIFSIEAISIAIFLQWYLSRYFHLGAQIPFGTMIAAIFLVALLIVLGGWLWDRRRARRGRA